MEILFSPGKELFRPENELARRAYNSSPLFYLQYLILWNKNELYAFNSTEKSFKRKKKKKKNLPYLCAPNHRNIFDENRIPIYQIVNWMPRKTEFYTL